MASVWKFATANYTFEHAARRRRHRSRTCGSGLISVVKIGRRRCAPHFPPHACVPVDVASHRRRDAGAQFPPTARARARTILARLSAYNGVYKRLRSTSRMRAHARLLDTHFYARAMSVCVWSVSIYWQRTTCQIASQWCALLHLLLLLLFYMQIYCANCS